jgi:hypothetical protein
MELGEKKTELTAESVLERTTTFSIYRHFLGDFKVGEPFCNPIRKEKHPSFQVNLTSEGLLHLDYSVSTFRGNCFQLVQQIYGCNYNTALEIIDRDLNLGIRNKVTNKSPIIFHQPKDLIITKLPPKIHIKTRKFNKTELKWWNMYYQDLSDLKRENIYAPKEIWINDRRAAIKESDLKFCYFYPEIGRWKIYTPTATDKKLKWFSNVPFNYCTGLKDIKGCKFGFLQKSKKDNMVTKKALSISCVADIQAENEQSLSIETIEHFNNNCEFPVSCMDPDPVGKRVSWYLTNNYGWKHCNVPDKYMKSGCTDFADMALRYGIDKVTEHFKSKGFLI